MSAECSKCGADLVYGPDGAECPECTRDAEITKLRAIIREEREARLMWQARLNRLVAYGQSLLREPAPAGLGLGGHKINCAPTFNTPEATVIRCGCGASKPVAICGICRAVATHEVRQSPQDFWRPRCEPCSRDNGGYPEVRELSKDNLLEG